jgi:hypothetical protein
VTDDCLISTPCLKEQALENDVLSLVLSYQMYELPNMIDFTLTENTNPEVIRLESLDTPVIFAASGWEVGNQTCGGPREAMINLEE